VPALVDWRVTALLELTSRSERRPMEELLFLDGKYMPLSEGRVSVEDRGFQFADGIYEVIRVYGGRPFQLHPHLKRLERSAEGIGLKLPYPSSELESICYQLIEGSGLKEGIIYIQLTRGAALRSHAYQEGMLPTTVIYVRGVEPLPEEYFREGVKLVTVTDIRWRRCDIKSISLLPNILAKQEAKRKGAFEALLVSPEGIVREGSSTNCFCAAGGLLFTHPLGPNILPGVTRAVVIDIACELGIEVREEPVHIDKLLCADEVFITGTNSEVMPCVSIDDKIVGDGRVGALVGKLHQRYRRRVDEECRARVAE